MRSLTDFFIFLAAGLTVVGVYVLPQQTFGGFHRDFGSIFPQQQDKLAKRLPVPVAPLHAGKVHSTNQTVPPKVEIMTAVVPITPRPPVETIHVGMEKKNLGSTWRSHLQKRALCAS
jgi:hypothetical protein